MKYLAGAITAAVIIIFIATGDSNAQSDGWATVTVTQAATSVATQAPTPTATSTETPGGWVTVTPTAWSTYTPRPTGTPTAVLLSHLASDPNGTYLSLVFLPNYVEPITPEPEPTVNLSPQPQPQPQFTANPAPQPYNFPAKDCAIRNYYLPDWTVEHDGYQTLDNLDRDGRLVVAKYSTAYAHPDDTLYFNDDDVIPYHSFLSCILYRTSQAAAEGADRITRHYLDQGGYSNVESDTDIDADWLGRIMKIELDAGNYQVRTGVAISLHGNVVLFNNITGVNLPFSLVEQYHQLNLAGIDYVLSP